MRTLLLSDPACSLHVAARSHPERPARLDAAVAGARNAASQIVDATPRPATREQLSAVHSPSYIDAIERFCAAGGGALDPDTGACAESWKAALIAAGAGPSAVEALRDGRADQAFLAVRPPGHHALADRAMGFCLFNNVAVTAALLRDEGDRVAIVDFDVHHGNGTQAIFYDDPSVLYLSLHQYPFYPGTGWLSDVGSGPSIGQTVNVPLSPGTAGDVYRAAVERIVEPVVASFDADWVLVSAGYDAHVDDPLADLALTASDYGWLAGRLGSVAPEGRLIYFLEGGYDLDAIETSVGATIDRNHQGPSGESPSRAWATVEETVRALAPLWDLT